MASRCGCGTTTCTCLVRAGSNVTVTGSGSQSNPYVISATGGAVVTTTIAGLNALATAANLAVGTTYIVTDWTVTSLPGPNRLYVEAIDPSTPSAFVQVETPLGDVGPADGEFLWNLSGTNLMTRLRDTFDNDVSDVTGPGGAIDTFPWGNPSVAHNRVVEGTFTLVPGFTLQDCTLDHASIVTTGSTNVALIGVEAQYGFSLNCTGGNLTMVGGHLGEITTINTNSNALVEGLNTHGQGAQLDINGGANTFVLDDVRIGGRFNLVITAAGTSNVTIKNCSFEGDGAVGCGLTLGGTDVTYALTDTDYFSAYAQTVDGGGGTVTWDQSRIAGTTFTRDAAATGDVSILECDLRDSSIVQGATASGTVSVALGRVTELNVAAGAGSTGSVSVTDCDLTFSILTLAAAVSGSITVQRTSMNNPNTGLLVTQNGSGSISLIGCLGADATISNAAGSVRPLIFRRCTLINPVVSYTRTAANSGTDTVADCKISDSAFTWAGATDPGGSQTVDSSTIEGDAQVTLTNPSTGTLGPMYATNVSNAGRLNVQASGRVAACRVAAGAIVNTGAFSHLQVIIEGNFSTTLTANNTGTLKNAGFSNTV